MCYNSRERKINYHIGFGRIDHETVRLPVSGFDTGGMPAITAANYSSRNGCGPDAGSPTFNGNAGSHSNRSTHSHGYNGYSASYAGS